MKALFEANNKMFHLIFSTEKSLQMNFMAWLNCNLIIWAKS